MTLEQLAQKIGGALGSKEHFVVAVSGFGGAGKTTLANKLQAEFQPDAAQLNIDDFVVNRGVGEGWWGGIDWARFKNVLEDIKEGRDLRYQAYDWNKDALNAKYVTKKLPKLVIVEGVRIFQPKLMPYFDLTIWVNASLEQATARGKLRDEQQWQNKMDEKGLHDHLQSWDETWAPKDKEYFEKFRPDKLADIIYENSE